jgi:hypothetical protein
MSTRTFLDELRASVEQFTLTHPEREAELAKAHALIRQGRVVPSPTDPAIGQVLSSDGQKVYHINGSCDCDAGKHGRECSHTKAWRLYQYIERRQASRIAQEPTSATRPTAGTSTVVATPTALPEARASLNFKALIGGFETQITLRSDTEEELLQRLQALIKRPDVRPLPKPAPKTGNWKQRPSQGR